MHCRQQFYKGSAKEVRVKVTGCVVDSSSTSVCIELVGQEHMGRRERDRKGTQ